MTNKAMEAKSKRTKMIRETSSESSLGGPMLEPSMEGEWVPFIHPDGKGFRYQRRKDNKGYNGKRGKTSTAIDTEVVKGGKGAAEVALGGASKDTKVTKENKNIKNVIVTL